MLSVGNQLDIFDDDPARLADRRAAANRIAAETALINPYESRAQQQERHRHYIAEAERYERIAAAARRTA